ncbi:MAG: Gfo/Idh/MocA family oxidoreductase [Spirochaetales bacterium]|nr:Gfo/Idh/MocA family oxidoreductase [Spirochaetales bacterium]
MNTKIRWGILSTANIGMKQVIPAMMKGSNCEIVAIASRNKEKAEEAAAELGIAKACGSYEELLSDPDIDAIYNPLPNHLHVEWSIKCMEAGKHVLCEKPITLTVEDVEKLMEARDRTGMKISEAFMVRSHLQWLKARDMVRKGDLGKVQSIAGFFSYYNTDGDNIRNKPEYGGGSLWDIGCYPVNTSRFIFGEEPVRVMALTEVDPAFKTDRLASAILEYPSGQAIFTSSTQLAGRQRMTITGTENTLDVEIPFNAPADESCSLYMGKGPIRDRDRKEIRIEACNQYTLQGENFSRAILENSEVPVTLEDSLANTKVLIALFQSAETGNWVRI